VFGPVTLEVDVQIVDPSHCSPVGCTETMLTVSAPMDLRAKP
jgi:hypothetical protein